MAKLTAAQRKHLPANDFANGKHGEGGSGSYPIPDENHARMALAMVSKHGTPAEKARVRAAVHRKFPNIKESEGKAAANRDRLIHK